MIELRILSRLLEYPDAELLAHGDELKNLMNTSERLKPAVRLALCDFINTLSAQALLDAQSTYGELFDRGRAMSLLLFEHVHGESRDRGQAMVDLLNQYARAGLELSERELPDHLPLYLEYLALQPSEQARQGLDDIAAILALLRARLAVRHSSYSVVFDALLALADSRVDPQKVSTQIAGEARDDTPAALDAVWEEEQVKFLTDRGCNNASIAAHQRRFSGAVAPHYLTISERD